ncbi:FecR domain-containing protein [Pararobbsia silviterrae]|nr:FecR domain-containing protein [Pararobbsia silviterrae]
MNARLDPRVVREAAVWLMRLHEPGVSEAERQAWRRWCDQSVEHERAWMRANAVASKFGGIPAQIGAATLDVPLSKARRKAMLGALSVAIAAVPSAWLASRLPWDDWSAEYRTATGERRRITLADQSTLMLNTSTSLDVAFDGTNRTVTLHRGEILVDTAMARQPFVVRTRDGAIRSASRRFDVRLHDAMTRVAVFEGSVDVSGGDATPHVLLRSGARIDLARGIVGPVAAAYDTSALWSQGVLFADDMPLSDVLDELSRYRRGIIRCDPSVAALRVSGSFQIDDTDRALRLLADTFALRVVMVTPYWVNVGAAET